MNIKELFLEVEDHLLKDEKPSVYLNEAKNKGLFDAVPFLWLKNLEKVDQSPKHHPEGNVWIHTMMVVDKGAKERKDSRDKRALMWALLLHDIGKAKTTKLRKGRLTSYDHDKVGEEEGRKFLKFFIDDNNFIDKVVKLIRYHMHLLFISKNMPYGDIEGMKKEADLHELAIVFASDRLGRGGIDKKEKEEVEMEITKFKYKYNK
ncbi:HD domain-containing protein [Clostridium paraputrificum]|uniref:HD domain-containing protein n=1 Tax=Clostridium TaxID=1485 RepID=UPI003D331A17